MIEHLSEIIGTNYVLTGRDMTPYCRDWPGAYEWQPVCVLRPASTREVSECLEYTYANGISVVPVSGNTSVSGGVYAQDCVMLSLDRLNAIEDINPQSRTARVQAGVIVENLHKALEEHAVHFPLLFGAQGTAQIGGALSTNAGGSNVLRYGNVRALCLGLEVVLPDGRIMDLMGSLHKDNTGYDLRDLMIGAEGTLGIITGAVLKLFPKPAGTVTALLACPTIAQALKVLPALQAVSGNAVEAFEYMPDVFMKRYLERIDGARNPFSQIHPVHILAQIAVSDAGEIEGDDAPFRNRIETTLAGFLEDETLTDAIIAQSIAQAQDMWTLRDYAAELALAETPHVGTDISVPTDRLQEFLDRANEIVPTIDPGCKIFWVAHLGDGNVHYTITISDISLYHPVNEAVDDIVQDLNGSFSAEHGVGRSKLASMAKRKDPVAISVMQAIKAAIDPKNLMNPGKVVPMPDDL